MSVLSDTALISWEFTNELLPNLRDTDKTRYERLINAASKTACRITKRELKAQDYTSILDGNGRDVLLLPEYPVNSVTSLYIDISRTFGDDTEETNYLYYEDTGKLVLPYSYFPQYPQCVKVLYNAGFDPIPEDLELAVLEVVLYNAKRLSGDAGTVGIRSIAGADGLNTAYELTIPVNAQRVFESYRRDE